MVLITLDEYVDKAERIDENLLVSVLKELKDDQTAFTVKELFFHLVVLLTHVDKASEC